MNIGIVTRPNESIWGGDLAALKLIKKGLEEQGHSVFFGKTAKDVIKSDFIFLSNTCLDQTENYEVLIGSRKRYGIITFHEDFSSYWNDNINFTQYIIDSLLNSNKYAESLESLDEGVSDAISLKGYKDTSPISKEQQAKSLKILEGASICITSSEYEKGIVLRDAPLSKVISIKWPVPGKSETYDDSILEELDLAKGGYLLQVGRMETRKNQLATILATKDMDIPLVFVATKTYQPWYQEACLALAERFRKAKTYFIIEAEESRRMSNVVVSPPMGGKILSKPRLSSLFKSASVLVCPAFYELPGLTSLESLVEGTPVVAGNRGSLSEYCEDVSSNMLRLVNPTSIPEITSAVTDLLASGSQEPTSYEFKVSDFGKRLSEAVL